MFTIPLKKKRNHVQRMMKMTATIVIVMIGETVIKTGEEMIGEKTEEIAMIETEEGVRTRKEETGTMRVKEVEIVREGVITNLGLKMNPGLQGK